MPFQRSVVPHVRHRAFLFAIRSKQGQLPSPRFGERCAMIAAQYSTSRRVRIPACSCLLRYTTRVATHLATGKRTRCQRQASSGDVTCAGPRARWRGASYFFVFSSAAPGPRASHTARRVGWAGGGGTLQPRDHPGHGSVRGMNVWAALCIDNVAAGGWAAVARPSGVNLPRTTPRTCAPAQAARTARSPAQRMHVDAPQRCVSCMLVQARAGLPAYQETGCTQTVPPPTSR